MPAPALYARESDGKDTLKCVNFNALMLFFDKKSDFFVLSLFLPFDGRQNREK